MLVILTIVWFKSSNCKFFSCNEEELQKKNYKYFHGRKKPVHEHILSIIVDHRKIQINLSDSWNYCHGIAGFAQPRFKIFIILKMHFYRKSVKIIAKQRFIHAESIIFVWRFL